MYNIYRDTKGCQRHHDHVDTECTCEFYGIQEGVKSGDLQGPNSPAFVGKVYIQDYEEFIKFLKEDIWQREN